MFKWFKWKKQKKRLLAQPNTLPIAELNTIRFRAMCPQCKSIPFGIIYEDKHLKEYVNNPYCKRCGSHKIIVRGYKQCDCGCYSKARYNDYCPRCGKKLESSDYIYDVNLGIYSFRFRKAEDKSDD